MYQGTAPYEPQGFIKGSLGEGSREHPGFTAEERYGGGFGWAGSRQSRPIGLTGQPARTGNPFWYYWYHSDQQGWQLL